MKSIKFKERLNGNETVARILYCVARSYSFVTLINKRICVQNAAVLMAVIAQLVFYPVGAQTTPETDGWRCSYQRAPNNVSTIYRGFGATTAEATTVACALAGGTSALGGEGCQFPENGNLIFGPTSCGQRFICLVEGVWEESDGSGYCPDPVADKNDGCTKQNGAGNPCNVATGNKFQSELDFSINELSLIRSYNSGTLSDLGLGVGWRSNFQKSLLVINDSLTQISGTGRGEPWIKVSGVWQGDADSDVSITEDASGYQLTNANGSVENYNLYGQLLSLIDANGHQATYAYNLDDLLDQVTNHYGQSISFSYGNGNVMAITDSLGEIYTYEYDTSNNLASVIYPDTTPSDITDNPRKIYHYENIDFPNHLTGITDENGNRYATYAYDADGKAIATEHAQTSNLVGQEKVELDYQ